MGCGSSKLEGAEDSIHVILSSEKRKQLKEQQQATGYKPRQQHPKILTQAQTEPDTEDNLDKLIYHASNHNDSIDKRDLEEYGAPDKEDKAWWEYKFPSHRSPLFFIIIADPD